MILSIGAAGIHLLSKGDALIDRAAHAVSSGPDALPDAVVKVVDGRAAGRLGASLLRVRRDAEQALLDVFA
jgi:hypothetical protein